MNNKRYPTRMHEVLGVEPNEKFRLAEIPKMTCFVDEKGWLLVQWTENNAKVATADYWASAINHGIIRKPRLTEEQVEQLRAIRTLGGRWLAKDETGDVFAYGSKPQKIMNFFYWNNDEDGERFSVMRELSVCALVSWSDPEPLDIVATLKAAGVEVE